jgi:hypothetical protein
VEGQGVRNRIVKIEKPKIQSRGAILAETVAKQPYVLVPPDLGSVDRLVTAGLTVGW